LSIRIGNVPGHGEVTRTYSLIGAAVESKRKAYRISVKKVPDGIMSSHITHGLRCGDVVRLQPPSGNFIIPVSIGFPVVLIAGGIGITPFLSYLESLVALQDPPEVILHYANQNSATHAFKRRLAELQAVLPRLTIVNYYEQPLVSDRAGVDYQSLGRISASAFIDRYIEQRARFYMCGPSAMMQALTDALVARGVPKFDIFKEEFRSPLARVSGAGQAFHVHFARSQCQATWRPEDGSLLAFGEALGISMPSGCRVGQCESCVLDLLAGQVRYVSAMANSEDDKCFACQAVPTSDIVLDV